MFALQTISYQSLDLFLSQCLLWPFTFVFRGYYAQIEFTGQAYHNFCFFSRTVRDCAFQLKLFSLLDFSSVFFSFFHSVRSALLSIPPLFCWCHCLQTIIPDCDLFPRYHNYSKNIRKMQQFNSSIECINVTYKNDTSCLYAYF